jgi:hypothetical protein
MVVRCAQAPRVHGGEDALLWEVAGLGRGMRAIFIDARDEPRGVEAMEMEVAECLE